MLNVRIERKNITMYSSVDFNEPKELINDLKREGVKSINLGCNEMNRAFAESCEGEYACAHQTQIIGGRECMIFTDDLDELCGGCAIYERLLQIKAELETAGREVKLFG